MRDFRFTDDQRAFQAAVRDYLAKECTPADVRRAASGELDDDRWQGLAELGVVGLTVPEAHGGLGMTFLDLVLLLEEAGHAALPEPLLEVTAIAAPLLEEAGGQAADVVLPQVAAGERRPVAVLERLQPHAPHANAWLLWNQEGQLVFGEQVALTTEQHVLDPTRAVAAVDATGRVLLEGASAARARRAAEARATVGAAALLVGLAARMTDMAVAYAQQREQFGQPIGRFQAVKHHLADCAVKIEFARPAVYRAAWSVTHEPDGPDTGAHASMAKVLATEAAEFTAKATLQVHGAIGYTHEHDLHLWMQRVWSLAASYGTADEHRARLRTHVTS